MKTITKLFPLALLASATMVSCNGKVEPAAQDEKVAVQFGSSINATTRAVNDKWTSGDQIGIFMTGENKASHLLKSCQRTRAVVVVRAAAPECLFVNLNFFFGYTAEHHRPQIGISYRKRFKPLGCRLVIPQPVRNMVFFGT